MRDADLVFSTDAALAGDVCMAFREAGFTEDGALSRGSAAEIAARGLVGKN
jgi:hypothetical protein